MKKLIYTIFLLSSFTINSIFSSCSEEKEYSDDIQSLIAKEVPITIKTDGILSEEYNFEDTRTRSLSQPDTVYNDLGDGWVMESVLEVEQGAKTRVTTHKSLKKGAYIMVMSIRNPGTSNAYFYKVETVKVGDQSSFVITLPNGEDFKLLCFTYDEDNPQTSFDYKTIGGGEESRGIHPNYGTEVVYFKNGTQLAKDFILDSTLGPKIAKAAWATTDISVKPGHIFSGLNFTELFTGVALQITSLGASNISDVKASISKDQALATAQVDYNTGTWKNGATADPGSNINIDFEGLASGMQVLTSNVTHLIPYNSGNGKTSVYIESLKIGDKYFIPKAIVSFNQSMVGGHRYLIKTKIQRGSNMIYYSADYAGYAAYCTIDGVPTSSKTTGHKYGNVNLYTGESFRFKPVDAKANCEFVGWYTGPLGSQIQAAEFLQTEITETDPSKDVYIDKATNMLVVKSTKETVKNGYVARYASTLEWATSNLEGTKDGTSAKFSGRDYVNTNMSPSNNDYFHGYCLNTTLDKTVTAVEKGDPCEYLGEGWRTPTKADFETLNNLLGSTVEKSVGNPSQGVIVYQKTSAQNKRGKYGVLKLPMGGVYAASFGIMQSVNTVGDYWTSTIGSSSNYYYYLSFGSYGSDISNNTNQTNYGCNIRCVRE